MKYDPSRNKKRKIIAAKYAQKILPFYCFKSFLREHRERQNDGDAREERAEPNP
jgi:hypothetical protein